MVGSFLIQTICAAGLLLPQADRASESDSRAAKLLPGSTAITIEIPKPVELLKSIVEHPIHDRAKKDKVLRKAYMSKEFLQVKTGVAFAEFAMGMKWHEAVNVLAGRGMTFALDAETDGGLVIVQSGNADKLPGLIKTLLQFVNNQRKQDGKPEIEKDQYRDVTVYKVDDVAIAVHEDLLLLTQSGKLGKKVLDALLDGTNDSLASRETWKASRGTVSADDSAIGFIDMQEVRDRGGIKNLLEGTKSNPFAEFLLGGVFESLSESPYVLAGLRLDDESLRLTAKTPYDATKVSEPREFYFGPEGKGRAPTMLSLDGSIGGATVYRDVARMWQYAGDLFDQNVNDQFAEAGTALSTLFAGKDFVEEILAEIKPNWQLVVTRKNFEDVLPRPAIKLPSFALVGEFKDAKTMNSEMKRVFQSMIGFFNVVGAMESGNPQLDQDIEIVDGMKIYASWFVPTPEDKKSTEASIHFNFSPSLALGEKHFVLASSTDLAMSAMKATAEATSSADSDTANMDFEVRGASLKQVLNDNREQLVANNMLEDGNSRQEAERQIDLLLGIVGWIDRLSARLQPSDDQLELRLNLKLREE